MGTGFGCMPVSFCVLAPEKRAALPRLYTEDAMLLPADQEPVQGRRAIEAHFQQQLAGTGEIQTGVADFTVSGSLAVASGRYWYRTGAQNGAAETVSGTYMMALRQEGRSWRIRSQIFREESMTP